MNLQEPKVEFVPIDQSVFTQSASNNCPDAVSESVVGGGQRCTGTQPEAKSCENWDESIPYGG